MEKTYLVTLTPDEDGWIVAECPGLPGCVSQGRSREEALANIREAIQAYIETLKDQGIEPPSQPTEITQIRIAS
ncbi:MAG TPA: type II toxin-antitoxin system HicB family antitoxin [Candidatus Binatia bacterium]|jgi:predicted RNase H-like HicB family nuclease